MNSAAISFSVENTKIRGHLITPDGNGDKKPGVIFLHGMESTEKGYLQLAGECADAWVIWLTMNARWHEGSEGDFQTLTVRDLTQDGIAAYDFLIQQDWVDPNRISICGSSVGAHMGLMVSAERKVKSLILRAPAVYTEEMLGMTLPEIMAEEGDVFSRIQHIRDTEALRAVQRFSGSVLLVLSEHDQIIPRTIPDALSAAAEHAKTVIIKNATHALTHEDWKREWRSIVVAWLQENW